MFLDKMDAAARKRKSREKLMSDPEKWRLFLEKEKKRDQVRRQKKSEELLQNKRKLDEKRQADRIRQRRCREKKVLRKETLNIAARPAYKCIQTLRKAVNKTRRALPSSPTKQQAVVLELAKATLPPQLINKEPLLATLNKRSDSLPDEHIKLVKSFYESDSVSRQTPNRKDVVRIRSQGQGTITIAKRHLVMTVSEVFELFKEKHPDVKIQKSKFFELRPFHVRVMSEIPHNVCVCVYHANFGFLVDSLKDTLHPTVNSPSQLLHEICCDVDNIDCMTGECNSCFDVLDLVNLSGVNLNAETKWKQWSKSSDGWLQIQDIKGRKKDLLREINNQIDKFKTHCFVKKEQALFFEKKKLETTETEGVLQIDFAENFSIISQDEIQSAHWKHPQATLFTCCVWFQKGQIRASYIIISNDELCHDKFAVWLYLKMIITKLKEKFPGLTKLTVFSDGCAAQFKNRFTISSVYYSNEDWGVKIDWAFFATSHGKGAVDGLGAAAKRRMWNAIKARKAFINSAWDCFVYLAGDPKGVIYLFASVNDISDHKEKLSTRWEDLNMLPQLQRNHFFRCDERNHISYSFTGNSPITNATLFRNKIRYEDVYSESEEEVLKSKHGSVEMEFDEFGKDKNEEDEYEMRIDKAHEVNKKATDEEEENEGRDEADERYEPVKDKNEKEINEIHEAGCSGLNNPQYNNGDYVLVKFPGHKIEYRYVGIINQINYNETEEPVVTFLRMTDKAAKLFKIVDNDISEIPFEQIVEKLPTPSIVQKGGRLFYKFVDSVNIYEK